MRYIEGEGEIRKRGEGMKSNAERREKKIRRRGGGEKTRREGGG